MAKLSKTSLSLIIVVVVAIIILGIKYAVQFIPSKDMVDAQSYRTKGNPDAELHIVEYIDLQCPACASAAQVLEGYYKSYPDRIFIELKHHPFGSHKHAFLAAQYTECAGQQGQFWPFIDLVLRRQNRWSTLNYAEPAFRLIAKQLELNFHKLDKCLKDEEVAENIRRDKEEGRQKGVKSTPTFFINGEIVVGRKSLNLYLGPYFNVKAKREPEMSYGGF